MKKYKIPLITASMYIVIILLLGFGVKDDYFVWTFPSWPFFIDCFENCGVTRMLIATVLNGIIIGLIFWGIPLIFNKIRNK